MIEFFVPGLPKAKGNHSAFVVPGTTIARVTENTKGSKSWAAAVSGTAADHRPDVLWDFPVKLTCIFFFDPPKYMLKGKARQQEWFHLKKPDLDKAIRNVKDCLTKVIYVDDCYVVEEHLYKTIGFQPGVSIRLERSTDWGFIPDEHVLRGTGKALFPGPWEGGQ